MENIDIRNLFPALKQKVNGESLVYLDSAATALKPKSVIERISQFYTSETANVHRGAHFLADQATSNFELTRAAVQKFINAKYSSEIIFVKGATEGINLIANSYSDTFLNSGDEIIVSELEHHANFVPWQQLSEKKKLVFKVIPVNNNGEFTIEDFKKQLTKKTKIVALTACSNTLGNMVDINECISEAHKIGAVVVVDAAQSITFMSTDVQKMNCDFLVFSGHKLFGPYGVGVVYGKKEIIEKMKPYQCGGSMISKVSVEQTTYNDVPFRFEAGTPNISGVIALAAAIDFVNSVGFNKINEIENKLLLHTVSQLKENKNVILYGSTNEHRGPIISFNLKGAHHSDVGQILNQMGVAVRVGHHCTQPLMNKLGTTGTVRISFSIYNNQKDIEAFFSALKKAEEILL